MLTFIQDFGILLLIIVVISFLVKLLKQPIIIGYVLAGLFFAYVFQGGAHTSDQIIVLSELGITFLLFLIGLEFDLRNLKHLGKDLIIATAAQSVIFFCLAAVPSYLLGFTIMESTYIGILFMFSSTLLVAKWIEDKKETATFRGRVILGILVIQDMFAIIMLTVLSVLQEKSLIKIVMIPLGGIALFIIAFVFAKYILNFLFKFAKRYPELLFIMSLGICFLFVEISPLLGYSTTIGAFIAGIVLANTDYRSNVSSRLKPLIIFFNMLFFVGLGFQMVFVPQLKVIGIIMILCALSIIAKPFVIYYTLRWRGYDIKTSFITGLNLAQLSEFGVIIVASGIMMGAISNTLNTIAIITVILTMVLSSYLIKYDQQVYAWLEPNLQKRAKPKKNEHKAEEQDADLFNVILFGYHELGNEIMERFEKMGKRVLVVDNDPANIDQLKKNGKAYVYDSVSNPYFFHEMNFENADIVVSNITDIEDNKTILKKVKSENPKSTVIVSAKSFKHSLELYDHGADYVLCPHYINEQQVSVILDDYTTDMGKILTKKINDISKMRELDKKEDEKGDFDVDKFLESLENK